MSEKRDAEKDLAVLDSAEKEFKIKANLGGWINMCLSKDMTDFIATAREALPHWIKRAQEAEAGEASSEFACALRKRIEQLRIERDQALAEAAVMRDALLKAQWCMEEERGIDYTFSLYYCPLCEREQGEGHVEDCMIAKALNSSPVATAYAERVQKLEAVVNTAKPAAMWMQSWLDEMLCGCERVHTCGRPEREDELAALKDALAALEVPADGLRS